jgi:hypothetical protein
MGIPTVKHAVFRLTGSRLVCDLYDPSTRTAYEVKTRMGIKEPDFRRSIGTYRELLQERVADHVVFVQVVFGRRALISYLRWQEIRDAGFQFLSISG